MKRWLMMSVMVVSAMLFTAAGCGTVCSGTSCACAAEESCQFDACTASTAGCDFACASGATCTGTCGANCMVACNGKTCTHAVGEGSNVACNAGSCNITCEGACSVAAVGGTLNLTCKSGTKGPGGCD